MAKLSLVVKSRRKKVQAENRRAANKAVQFPTRIYNRCKKCGRPRGYIRKFDLCRICFRELARDGKIMGVTKSSW